VLTADTMSISAGRSVRMQSGIAAMVTNSVAQMGVCVFLLMTCVWTHSHF
jgi:hypothetical protein